MCPKSALIAENSVHLHTISALSGALDTYFIYKDREMNKTFAYLVMLVAGALTFSSCLSDDDDTEYTYYGDTAITAFSLGTVNRYLTSKTTNGNDTTISSTVTGSNYKFVIDQTAGKIYNNDSLPYGCSTKAVLATISSKNSGYVYIKSLTSDSLTYYSSSDSIDFSSPRTLRVFSQDFSTYRDYTATVNVHKQMEGEFTWGQLANVSDDISTATGLKLVAMDGKALLLAGTGSTTTLRSYADGTWATLSPNMTLSADAYKSGLAWGGYYYVASDGNVLRSQDGTAWSQVASATAIKQLVAASTNEIYGLTASGIAVSKDGGATWTDETLDSDASLLPTDAISYTCSAVKTNTQMERVMIVGTQTGSPYAKAWTKLADYSATPVASKWNYVDVAGDTQFALKVMKNLAVISYNGVALGFGYADNAFSTIYQSVDYGITWKTTTDYTLPTIEGADIVAVTTDSDNYIWIVGSNGTAWRGRLNDLGW